MSARMRLTKLLSKTGPKRSKPVQRHVAENKKQWNVVRGDKVQLIDRGHLEVGKQGIVKKVIRKLDRVIVEGINMHPKHIKGNPDKGVKGRTIQKERSLPYSSVSLLDPVSNQPTRIYRKVMEDGTKVRVSKSSGAVIPRPEILTFRKRPVSSDVCAVSDTSVAADVWEVTYEPPPPPPQSP